MTAINYHHTLSIFQLHLLQNFFYYHKIHTICQNILHHNCIDEFRFPGIVLNCIYKIKCLLFYYFLSNNLTLATAFKIHLHRRNLEDITNNNFQNYLILMKENKSLFHIFYIRNIRNHLLR